MHHEVLEQRHVFGEPSLAQDAVHAAKGERHPAQQQRRQPQQAAVPRPRPEGEAPESLVQVVGVRCNSGECWVVVRLCCVCWRKGLAGEEESGVVMARVGGCGGLCR